MIKHFSLLFLLFVASSGALGDEFTPVKNSGIDGAIIPMETVQSWQDSIRRGRGSQYGIQQALGVEAQSFWTPQPKDIKLVESRLKAALKKAVKEPATLDRYATTPGVRKYVSGQIEQIIKHYNEYQHQYIGLVINGKRHIYLNSFAARDGMSYAKHFVKVSDGSFWYWQILYSVDNGSFFDMSINGEA